jgi:hypothetical protein
MGYLGFGGLAAGLALVRGLETGRAGPGLHHASDSRRQAVHIRLGRCAQGRAGCAVLFETLNKFSVSECRNKFAVASDVDQKITKSYDASLFFTSYSDRTSYVIAPNGMIIYAYTALNPDKHVENTMAAVAKWQAEHKKGS